MITGININFIEAINLTPRWRSLWLVISMVLISAPISHGQISSDSTTAKGLKIPTKKAVNGVTRAVLVGISNYQDDDIPDLQYAHKDIQVYYDYLTNSAHNPVPEENIKMLLNEEATGGNVHKALYWLIKESQENDVCIIYFSGHGDVETIYPDEPGHFLVFDSPSSIYQINSLRIDDLKRITRTLSEQNKAQVILLSDACRSGKLAGSEVSGSQATSAALAAQFANEIKIMSCQPNEYSVEGPQWGGGRGIFSYHLVDGLIGLADDNEDQSISLKEIQRYLEDRFEEDLKHQTQTPLIVGNRNTSVAKVNEVSLIALKSQKNMIDEGEGSIANVTNKKTTIKPSDEILQKFYTAINDKIYLISEEITNHKSAEYYYNLIASNPDYTAKHPILKGDLISALQDEAQAAINRYLAMDYYEMMKRYKKREENYDVFPLYLNKAAELLTSSHYLYPQIKAKALYFESVVNRLKLERESADPIKFIAYEDKIVEALTYDGNVPYLWHELGLLYFAQAKYEKAEINFNKAIQKSPTWVLPYHNKTNISIIQKKYTQAIERANRSLKIDSSFIPAYYHLANANLALDSVKSAIEMDKKLIAYFGDDFCMLYNNIGHKYFLLNQAELAISFFDNSIECDSTLILAYLNKSGALRATGQKYKAIDLLISLSNRYPNNVDIAYKTGSIYQELNEITKAETYLKKVISLDPNHRANQKIGLLYLQNDRVSESIEYFEYYLQNVDSTDQWTYFDNACAYAYMGKLDAFVSQLEKAIQNGFSDLKEYESSKLLDGIKDTQEYTSFLSRLK